MFKALKAVLWGFLGVRHESGRKEDFKINIIYIFLAGIFALIVFIGLLIGVIKFIVLQ